MLANNDNILTNCGMLLNNSGPIRRFSTHVWENARLNTVTYALMYDISFKCFKILQLYNRDCAHVHSILKKVRTWLLCLTCELLQIDLPFYRNDV